MGKLGVNKDSIKATRVPCNYETFWNWWFTALRMYHNLTDREIDVAAAYAKKRYELSKVIKDETILDLVLMNEDSKKAIREECNLTPQHFLVILYKLKNNKVIIDGKLNPRFLPRYTEGLNQVGLLFIFDLNDVGTNL